MVRFVPQPVQSFALPDAEARRETSANTITLALDNAVTRKELRLSGRTLWAIDGTDGAEIEVFLTRTQTAGIPFSPGMRISGMEFSQILYTCTAQAGASITLLYTQADLDAESPAQLFAEVNSAPPYDRIGSTFYDASMASSATALLFAANPKRRFVELNVTSLTDITVKYGSAPSATGDGYTLRMDDGFPPLRFFDDGAQDIYILNGTLTAVRAFEGVIV